MEFYMGVCEKEPCSNLCCAMCILVWVFGSAITMCRNCLFINFGAPIRVCRDIASYIQFVSLCHIWTPNSKIPLLTTKGSCHVLLKVG